MVTKRTDSLTSQHGGSGSPVRRREAQPGAPGALPARIPRSRAADAANCTVCTGGSVHEPVPRLVAVVEQLLRMDPARAGREGPQAALLHPPGRRRCPPARAVPRPIRRRL